MANEIKKQLFYIYEGKRGIIDYVDGFKVFIPEDKIDETEFDEPDELPLVTYDDSYTDYSGEHEIVEASVQNIENEQRLIDDFVTLEWAQSDEYVRELLTTTDGFYEWRSWRSIMISRIKKVFREHENDEDKEQKIKADLRALRDEWKKTVAEYTDPLCFADGEKRNKDFNSLLREVGNGAEEYCEEEQNR